MVEFIPPPDLQTLLPPFLACLPAAFVATRPPPVLFPLLSPILRQRVHIFSSMATSAPSPEANSWLRLLCWGDDKADRVASLVEGIAFEPHPASGEVEVPESLSVTYKRLDEETLKAQVALPEYKIGVQYVWCSSDPDGGGSGWRIAEVVPREGPADTEEDETWSASIQEANARARERVIDDALREAEEKEKRGKTTGAHVVVENVDTTKHDDDDDDEDAYWARYDATPGRTPSIKTPAPRAPATTSQMLSEDNYFAQYAGVQPVMDSHDPSVNPDGAGETTLNGDLLSNLIRQHTQELQAREQNSNESPRVDMDPSLNHPRPASTSSGSDAIAKLEQEAENRTASEVAIKQHISTSIKSLYRLAKATGMGREEFQNLVRTEVELLELADDD
ncbi:hypothetical protein VTN31DRAFT_3643 [Thermomyces dupontii]|uniref:uncharacterized protein n=1 Tax=Talaromyces thermophilus TaxID=28565 RepID=UPI00374346B5